MLLGLSQLHKVACTYPYVQTKQTPKSRNGPSLIQTYPTKMAREGELAG